MSDTPAPRRRLIPIGVAARRLFRSPRTLRRWDERGFTPDGSPFHAATRDVFTGQRLFDEDVIDRIDASKWTRPR